MSTRSLALLSLFFFSFATGAQPPVGSQSQVASQEPNNQHFRQYKQLVERVKKGDLTVDFVQLISAASDWDRSEKGVFEPANREAMVEAFKKKNYKKAVELAEVVLDYEFTNRGLHLATANAYKKLAENEKADLHSKLAEKILTALLTTGDGKSVETAYCVQSINEEYVIMRHFGYKVTSQAYIMSNMSGYDLLSGKDEKTGKDVGLYFDISGLFTRCLQSHQEKKN